MITHLALLLLSAGSGQLGTQEAVLTPSGSPGTAWGQTVDVDGPWAVVSRRGAYTSSEVTLFERQGQTWVFHSVLAVSGRAASISGNDIVYGKKTAFHAETYQLSGGLWAPWIQIPWNYCNHDQFGWATAMHGDRAAISARDWGFGLGAVFVYDLTPAGWVEIGWFDADLPLVGLGERVDIGDRFVVAPTSKKVIIYDILTNTCEVIDPGDPAPIFSVSAATSGDTVAVGKPGEADALGVMRGAVYMFEFNGSEWVRTQEVRASDGLAGDRVGSAVALDGDVMLVAADSVVQPAGIGGGAVYAYRRVAGAWVELGRFGQTIPGSGAMGGDLAFDGDVAIVSGAGEAFTFRLNLALPPTSYCTAGTTASGCQAALAGTGTPSASLASGFDVTVSDLEGQKDGTLYFGSSGIQAAPWGNGSSLQCVTPPVVRTGVLAGSGTQGACDGSFQLDLNAWLAAHPQSNPGAGVDLAMQCWFRDPLSTSNQSTSLSSGLLFTLCP